MINRNLNGSDITFEQDGRLAFNEEEHIYTLNGIEMRSVSCIVAMFFREFDAVGISLKKCYGNEIDKCLIVVRHLVVKVCLLQVLIIV